VLLGLVLVYNGCKNEAEIKTSTPPWLRVYFSPQDDIPAVIISLVSSARYQVWAAFYSMDHPGVAAALLAAADRGVDVRVVMDDAASNSKRSRAGQLRRAGLLVTDIAPGDLMHNKFIVIDDFIVLTGSCNPTITGMNRDNNNLVVISSRQAAGIYAGEFLEMWKGKFGTASPYSPGGKRIEVDGTRLEIFFSPEDDCLNRLVSLIDDSHESVEFACFAFTLVPVAEALIHKHEQGVTVRGVLERGQNSPYNVFRLLDDSGIPIRWDQNLKYLHHKFFVIDNLITVTGSFNPSVHARKDNDENLIVIYNQGVAGLFRDEFERLYRRQWE